MPKTKVADTPVFTKDQVDQLVALIKAQMGSTVAPVKAAKKEVLVKKKETTLTEYDNKVFNTLLKAFKDGVAKRQYVYMIHGGDGAIIDLSNVGFVTYYVGAERKSLKSCKGNTTEFARWVAHAYPCEGCDMVVRYSPSRDRWMAYLGHTGGADKEDLEEGNAKVYDLARKCLVVY